LAQETWVEVGSVVASDAAGGDGSFGDAVAISGATMVVGDPLYDREKGRAYVYSLNGNAFDEVQVLPVEEAKEFGSYVAVDGDTIVIGAQGSNAAFVFAKNGREWELQQTLRPSDASRYFGVTVAVDGDRIVVGNPFANKDVGAAHVFDRSGTTWKETQILVPSDNPTVYGEFGYDVDVEGDTIVVGAPLRNSVRGAVYVFALITIGSTKEWVERKIVEASDGANGDWFGKSVALSGSSIVVGSPYSGNGNAYVYDVTRSFGLDFEETKLLQGDATGEDNFGDSVALSGDTAV
jgi:hypothetical protein